MAKKILHLTQSTGGVKTYVAHVLQYATNGAFEFVIAAPTDPVFEQFCAEKAIPYYEVDLSRTLNPVKNIFILYKLIQIIKKEKPALIHAHSAKGGLLGRIAAKITGVKVIYTPHAFSYLSFTGVKRVIFYLLEYLTRGWTTLLLAISYSEANCAVYELGYPKHKVKTTLNAIPVNMDKQTNEHNYIRVSMIGRLTLQKNPMQFLEIAGNLSMKYPALKFTILGAGIHDDLMNEIHAYLHEHNLNQKVKIEAWGDTNKSEQLLKDTDIYIMTSVFEGLPFSLLEAMYLKIPCVVSKVIGNTDVIQNNENGFSCLSVEEFYEKIELLINDRSLRVNIGEAAHQYVLKRHNIKTNVLQLEEIYQKL